MNKNTLTEKDFTAQYLGSRQHKGTGLAQKKIFGERRGRKPKQGRVIRKFKINLLPNEQQVIALQTDLHFFNKMYLYTREKLKEPFHKESSGLYRAYDMKKRCKTGVFKLTSAHTPHTPKFIMNSQNELIKEYEWMKAATYQVSYRATVNAFADYRYKIQPTVFNGTTYEAKICYRLVNGLLYIKKAVQTIRIKETLPKGSLETIRITKEQDNTWTAIIEILEPYDKAEDIREGKNGVLETDTKEYTLHPTYLHEGTLIKKMHLFSDAALRAANEAHRNKSISEKIKYYIPEMNPLLSDIGLLNMACVAASARAKRYKRARKKDPLKPHLKMPKNYFAISEGFYFEKNVLHLTRWGMSIPMDRSPLLYRRGLDYIVIKKDQKGNWLLTGKKRRHHIVRSLARIVREFSWRDNMLFLKN